MESTRIAPGKNPWRSSRVRGYPGILWARVLKVITDDVHNLFAAILRWERFPSVVHEVSQSALAIQHFVDGGNVFLSEGCTASWPSLSSPGMRRSPGNVDEASVLKAALVIL